MEERIITLKLLKVGPYSRAFIVPGWWLKLNGYPEELEVTLKMGEIAIRPKVVEEKDDGRREAEN